MDRWERPNKATHLSTLILHSAKAKGAEWWATPVGQSCIPSRWPVAFHGELTVYTVNCVCCLSLWYTWCIATLGYGVLEENIGHASWGNKVSVCCDINRNYSERIKKATFEETDIPDLWSWFGGEKKAVGCLSVNLWLRNFIDSHT